MSVLPTGDDIGLSHINEASSSTPTANMTSPQPPYPAPADTVYPENTISNPYVLDMNHQPVFSNLPAGSLYRPTRLPADMDMRLEKGSVWISTEKTTRKAVYFLPPICVQCSQSGQNCDRGYPDCQRCTLNGTRCEPGAKWSRLQQKSSRNPVSGRTALVVPVGTRDKTLQNGEEDEGFRYSAAEKGKGKAETPPVDDLLPGGIGQEGEKEGSGPDAEMELDESFDVQPNHPRYPDQPLPFGDNMPASAEGRGQRTKKKRRLSAGEEIDPETIDDDGNLLTKRPLQSLPPPRVPSPIIYEPPKISTEELKTDDTEYFVRVEKNGRKPVLKNMRAACPAWATTRRALQSGAEYFRNPVKIDGGSVEVGVGGVARGLILEGQSVGGGNFWGTKAAAGSIVVSLGSARPRQAAAPPEEAPSSSSIPQVNKRRTTYLAGPSTPRINILPSVLHLDKDGRATDNIPEDSIEQPEIDALLLTQRARTPMAIAVAQDYLEPPFKVPRAFVVLGWFWLTDAWVEPEDLWQRLSSQSRHLRPEDINLVRWKFRFEWCRGTQGVPWWSPNDDPSRIPTPYIEYKFIIEPLDITGPGIKGSSTVIPSTKKRDTDLRAACPTCSHISEGVYRDAKVCLNEGCEKYFMPSSGGSNIGLDPITNTPCLLRPLQRKVPEFLGLKLRGYDPFSTPEDGVPRDQLGGDYWRGWVCGKCGMANERRRWSGWDCDGCKHQIYPPRKPLTPQQLSNPLHPGINQTGAPRTDIGYPSFPQTYKWTAGTSLFEHHIKVVKHVLLYDEQASCEIYQALHARREHVVDVASRVWKDLQGDGGEERRNSMGALLRRGIVASIRRPAERHASSFYTMACGPDTSFRIAGFPTTLDSVPWPNVHVACLDAIDLINFRAGCMFPGLSEMFNSLIVAVTPPPSVPTSPVTIILKSGEYLAFLILGSEATVSIRLLPHLNNQGDEIHSSEPGTMIVQHGDVLGMRADKGAVEISIQMDGFGAVCIAQQVYRAVAEPGLGALTMTTDREPNLDGRPTTPSALGEIDPNTSMAPPPLRSMVFIPAPLKDWYVGPRPLDVTQPMRFRKSLRIRSIRAPEVGNTEENASNDIDIESTNRDDEDFGIDPNQATGYIIIDNPTIDDDDINDSSIGDTSIVLVADIPPSPTITPSIPGPKRRNNNPTSTSVDHTPDGGPKKKRKYVFKNKGPSLGEGGMEDLDDDQSKVVKSGKPRPKPKGKDRRVSEITGLEEDGLEVGMMDTVEKATSSTVGTTSAGARSPTKKPGRPRKSGGNSSKTESLDQAGGNKLKKGVGRPRKSQVIVDIDMVRPVQVMSRIDLANSTAGGEENEDEAEGMIIAHPEEDEIY